jgi:hypothetical protein
MARSNIALSGLNSNGSHVFGSLSGHTLPTLPDMIFSDDSGTVTLGEIIEIRSMFGFLKYKGFINEEEYNNFKKVYIKLEKI